MKIIVASACAMALFLNPVVAKDCSLDQLNQIIDLTDGDNGLSKCLEKVGDTNLSEGCNCFNNFVEAYNAVDCNGAGKLDLETEPDFADAFKQCTKGNISRGNFV
jgi:hypothetical protein